MEIADHRFLRHSAFIALLLCIVAVPAFSQTRLAQFKQLSGPMKRWTLCHPWAARKALPISRRALALTDSVAHTARIGSDYSGGKLDAFRHGIWMALLVREIPARRAYRLGKAYEKGNRKEFDRGQLEDGSVQDAVASMMDLQNNRIGLAFGYELRQQSEAELISSIVALVSEGRFTEIKKDVQGNSLDLQGNIIPDDQWRGKWENGRCLVGHCVDGTDR